ncbi:MAG: hypothetical protein H3C30_11845 [Candidatus Hydrogenedentes bacterium]|nr:hypothetical protein [Candidatus Hydrogenedentota bacterium]
MTTNQTLARIPVAVVTGFLGTGKSTLLASLFNRYRGRRLAWVVNEFSSLDMDGQWLRMCGLDVLAVPGGSLFCACLATAFQRVMGGLGRLARDGCLDGVVIEASGMSRLDPLDGILVEFHLDDLFQVASVTALVDPATFPVIARTLPCAVTQVQAADHIIINKTDLSSKEVVNGVMDMVRELVPVASLHVAVRATVDLDVLVPVRKSGHLPGAWAKSPDPAFSRICVQCPASMEPERLAAEIQAIGATLYRAKGLLRVANGAVKLDWSGGALQMETVMGIPDCPGLVLFPHAGQEGPAQNLARRLACGEV